MLILPHLPLLLFSAAELCLLCLAVYQACRRRDYAASEAVASAPMVVLLFFTVLFQQHHLLQLRPVTITLEAGACLTAAWYVWRGRSRLAADCAAARRLLRAHPVVSVIGAALALYLGCQALLLSFLEAGSKPVGTWCAMDNTAAFTLMLQRFDLVTGYGLISFMAYIAIGAATYALARRHAWPDTAFLATLIVLSFPRLVLLATAPAEEGSLVFAAMYLFLLLSCYRLIEVPGVHDLGALAGATLFCLSGTPLQMSLTAILLLLTATLLNRRHGRTPWLHILSRNPRTTLLYLAPLALMLLFLVHLPTLRAGVPPSCRPATAPNNSHGLQGAMANLLRYGFESADLTPAGDLACELVTGERLTSRLQRLYDHRAAPWTGNRGTRTPFVIHWELTAPHAGFGPFGLLFVLPAIGYCLVRGSRRLKSLSLAFFSYLLLVCLVSVWQPGNAAITGYFYICGGFMVSHFLPPWRLQRTSRKAVCACCLALMVYSAAGNTAKPLADFDRAVSGLGTILSGEVGRGLRELRTALARGAWGQPHPSPRSPQGTSRTD